VYAGNDPAVKVMAAPVGSDASVTATMSAVGANIAVNVAGPEYAETPIGADVRALDTIAEPSCHLRNESRLPFVAARVSTAVAGMLNVPSAAVTVAPDRT
jgi:hypothetical protein